MLDFTPEQLVAKSYSAALDSVNLINAGKPQNMTDLAWADILQRNKEHLSIQIAKTDYYAGFDMAPLVAATVSPKVAIKK